MSNLSYLTQIQEDKNKITGQELYGIPTRNIYMKTERCLDKKMNDSIMNNRLDPLRRFSDKNMLPYSGINIGMMPSSTLSSNPTEIENELYGLYLSNGKYQIKERKRCITPRIKKLQEIEFYGKPSVFLPEPLVIENNQRPIIP